MNPFDAPRDHIDWPQAFELRIIVDAPLVAEAMTALEASLAALGVSRGPVVQRESSKPRFARLAVPVEAADKAAMERLYAAVGTLPGFRYAV